MEELWNDRTILLLGQDKVNILEKSHVLIAGVGGVGGYVCEFLTRAGVGEFTLVDHDTIKPSNLNRQIIATQETIGEDKVKEMKKRLQSIQPDVKINVIKEFYRPSQVEKIFGKPHYDYAVDAIDSLVPKISFLKECVVRHIPVVSSMGAGGRIVPEQIQIADISQTHHCRLAANVRNQLRKAGIDKGIKTVFSEETMASHCIRRDKKLNNKIVALGTISYLPAIFGGFIASVVLRDLIEKI